MILLDQRYQNDPRYAVNRRAIEFAQTNSIGLGITAQALLEVVGILSFNVSSATVTSLAPALISLYGLTVRPDLHAHPEYANCTVSDLMTQITSQMALGDAVQQFRSPGLPPTQSACSLGMRAIFKGKSWSPC